MDLEILEALALADNRAAALSQLLPGSEDHDYFRCLHAQHRGDLDEADAILEAWPDRHGSTVRYQRMRVRQDWCRLGQDPARAADAVRDRFGVSHWHEADVPDVDAKRPAHLAPDAFSGEALLAEAARASADLSQVTDEGLYELLGRELDVSRRRSLLARIDHTSHPALVTWIADDLASRGSSGFGSLAIHQRLTLEQLLALAQLDDKLRTNRPWVDAVVRRMQPPASVDIDVDREARDAYLTSLWQLVRELPPANNSLKAHVLWHLLDTRRRLTAQPDGDLLVAYLQLPRAAPYVRRDLAESVRREDLAQVGADYREVTGLPPATDDEALVRDLLHRKLGDAERYAPWLDRDWLAAEIAAAQLLYGVGDAERATKVLGPTRAAALRERVDLEWCVHNPTQFTVDEPLLLDVDLKNVPELVVKVFRIDPLAYFQIHRREVSSDADLDGLAASQELVLRFDEPPVRRHRRRIDLPMCRRAGTYVIDLIGNGMSSRAVVHKGRLRQVSRVGAAGRIVTIFDEQGRRRADARAWIGDREYVPDEHGSVAVPFSTAPARTPMLLSAGDLATVHQVALVRESYQLELDLHVDRQALTAKSVARAIARVQLTAAGAPASLALLEHARWEVALRDRAGVATTKEYPLVLSDDDAAVLEIPLGETTCHVAVTVRARVRVLSEQRDEPLTASRHVPVAAMHDTLATEALYLAETEAGWVISALGKSGEPRAGRPLTISLDHRWAHAQLNVELATDARGRCELGALPGIVRISATLGGVTQTWQVGADDVAPGPVHTKVGRDIVIALPASRQARDVIARASLVEVRRGLPTRQAVATLEPLAGAIVVRGLAPGEYVLRAPGIGNVTIRVAVDGPELAGHVIGPRELLELSRTAPAIAELDAGEHLRVRLVNATPRTRVHVIATRFFAAPVASARASLPPPVAHLDRPRLPLFVSGRELGDEYRYVLERRNAKRFPGLLVEKPSLLLNAWSRRTTTTDVAVAAAGRPFATPGAAASAARYAGAMQAAAPQPADEAAYAAYDFLADPPRVLANLVVDTHDTIAIPRIELGDATCVTVIVEDPAGSSRRRVALPEAPLAPRDLRLQLALEPDAHVRQNKAVVPLRAGDAFVVEDLATAKVHLLDSIERAHAYLLSLRDDATLREFSFVTRWHELGETERRALYSKYACHELHLFLYFKDRASFDAVVRPYLAHKRTKTFVDHWLLHGDLTPYLEPWRLNRLNAVERALLAQRMLGEPALARTLSDEVSVQRPDPALDTRIIDALLGGAALERDSTLQSYARDAIATKTMAMMAAGAAPMELGEEAAAPPAPRRRAAEKKKEAPRGGGGDGDELDADRARRRDEAPMYRTVDRTQEWAENNWWHLTPQETYRDLVLPSRFWRDFALHETEAFLSPWLGLANGSFAEAMCALAVTELPFVPGAHAYTPDGAKLTIHAAANTLAGSAQLVAGDVVGAGAPLVVGQSYVRTDDRYRYVDGEQVDKYVEGPFVAGVVYTCQVVLANPSSSRQRVTALVQIPRGSIALAGAQPTQTLDVALEAYGTHGHEYSFYFPLPGRFTHFPVHVSRGDVIVVAAAGRTLDVTDVHDEIDPQSWAHLSQHGSLPQVVAFLDEQNLADVDLERVAWRLRDRAAYDAILSALERRRRYDATSWGYALLHGDAPRIRVWARALDAALLAGGPVLDMPVVDLDAEALDGYEHLELAPLINARAHRLGAKLRILNDGLAAQYGRFLELVAHRRAPTSEDHLAAAHYLLAQDRASAALGALARVDVEQLADRMQHDYLAAYAACLVGDTTRARELVARWRQQPVERWRLRFDALGSMLDELAGVTAAAIDPDSRDQQHAQLAARQPAFDIAVDREGIVVRQQHVAALELRFFEMDAELLFSRQPFVQSDVSRLSFIEPGHREVLQAPPPELRLPWPLALRGKNVVVEAVGAGQRRAKIHYANDLATQLAHQYGQLRVQRASDGASLPATYVKVYAQKRGGDVAFYKDGYTDLRGWFDYASLSTSDLDHVEKFAILVASDHAGSAILEAGPPAR